MLLPGCAEVEPTENPGDPPAAGAGPPLPSRVSAGIDELGERTNE